MFERIPGWRSCAAFVLSMVVLAGCGGGSTPDDAGNVTGDRDPVEGVAVAPVESDAPAADPLSSDQINEAVRSAGAAYLAEQFPGADVAIDAPNLWLRPGDTGAVHIARWTSTSADSSAAGQLALSQASNGSFTVAEAESDSANGPANLTNGAILVARGIGASQTPDEAARDGIAPLVALLELPDRVDLGWGAPDYLSAPVAQDDRWIVSRYPLEVGIELRAAGQLADVDTILGYELLHLAGGDSTPATVVQAIPIDVLSPAWVAVGNGATYSGRKAATSGLNPILIRIDGSTGVIEKMIAVMPDRVISDASLVPAGWTIATQEQSDLMITIAHAAPDFVLIDQIFALGVG